MIIVKEDVYAPVDGSSVREEKVGEKFHLGCGQCSACRKVMASSPEAKNEPSSPTVGYSKSYAKNYDSVFGKKDASLN